MSKIRAYMRTLNSAQREVVEHNEGSMLVVAGPGSGKTRVLVTRIARLLDEEVCGPEAITAITFTHKAAGELRTRLSDMVSQASLVRAQTFHAMCLRILRKEASAINLIGYRPSFSVYDERRSSDLVKKLVAEMMQAAGGRREGAGKDFVFEISRRKAMGVGPVKEPRNMTDEVYIRYQEELLAHNAMDFDDLQINTLKIFDRDPSTLQRARDDARYLLVDEYQDTSPVQYELVLALGKHGSENVCVVGDPDQSIYGFRGADIGNILNFSSDFPKCRNITLSENYRSTRTILTATDRLISCNNERIDKVMSPNIDHDEPIRVFSGVNLSHEVDVCARLARQEISRGVPASEIMVVGRTNALVRAAEKAFRANKVPCETVGVIGFYDRKEIKDVLAYLRILSDPDDEDAYWRILNAPARGIGDTTQRFIKANRLPRESSIAAGERLAHMKDGLPPKASQAIIAFMDMLEAPAMLPDSTPITYVYDVMMTKSGYAAYLSKDGGDRLVNADQLRSHLTDLHRDGVPWRHTLADFLEYVDGERGVDSAAAASKDSVQIMTVHKSKGLEATVVFYIGLCEGISPDLRGELGWIEEERRIAFVGMTRAKKILYLSRHDYTTVKGRKVEQAPSRFFREIPGELRVFVGEPDEAEAMLDEFVMHGKYGRGLVVGYAKGRHRGEQILTVNFADFGQKEVIRSSVSLSQTRRSPAT